MSNKEKFFYFHTPKTAGTSINKFFTEIYPNSLTHVEGKRDQLGSEFINKYHFISGHVSYSAVANSLAPDWVKLITFREPYSYAVSHLSWIRKLADEGEEKRFNTHPEIFQKIALKMKSLDFSKSEDIVLLKEWLESMNFHYLFNTQTIYLDVKKNINIALKNLSNIEFVGIMEDTDGLLDNMEKEFLFTSISKEAPRVNINNNKYGFNLKDSRTREALLPFIDKDITIYKEATKLFNKQRKLYQERAIDDIIGYIDSINKNKIRGWCRSKNSLQKLELELRLDNQIIATTIANKYRLGLKEKGIHFTGRCAFEFDLESSIDTDKLQVYIANTNVCIDRL